jgi:hypothetical protein
MKVICVYCKADLGEKEPYENKAETHGACTPCFEAEMKEIKKKREGRKKTSSG